MRTMEKIRKFVKRYETRLLLLAVLLTAGAALRTAAYAKYNSYLEDSSSAVAGDFYFTSDYLAEGEGMTHYITTWDGEHYDCPIRIQNYENSLRYNHADTDFFYTVEGAVYMDEECTIEDEFYGANGIKILYGGQSDSGVAVIDDGVKYGLLCGTEQFSTENGAQTIRVSCDRDVPLQNMEGSRYFKVTLRTVPLYKANELQAQLPDNLKANYNTTRGVYYGELSCVFVLSRSTEDASVTESLHTGSDYTIRYTLSCKSGNADVCVYYDHTKVVPDGALGAIGTENGKRYITTHVQSSAETDCYFFRLNLDSTIAADDFSFKVLSGAESEDDTVRAIHVDSGWTVTDMSGNDLSGGAKAKTMVKLIPPQSSTQVIAALSVTPEGLATPISTTFVEDGNYYYYYFEMPGSAVNVTPTWHYTTRITVMPDGDIIHGQIVQPSPVAAGAAVVLTIQPDDGYQLGTISVKDSANEDVNLTTILDGLTYQFVMPAGGANVSASFVAAQAPEEP